MRSTLAGLLLASLVAAPAAALSHFFDSFDPPGLTSSRPAEDSPGSQITPSKDVVITNISVRNRLNSAGNIRYVIFDHLTSELLFATDPEPVVIGTQQTWKKSQPFYFLLRAGVEYDIGAITDVTGDWSFDSTSNTNGGVSSVGFSNPNFANFANPVSTGPGGADGAVRLHTIDPGLLLDSFEPPGSVEGRNAGSAPGIQLEVHQDVILTGISVHNALGSAGDVRFLVFDHDGHTLLHASDAEPFPSDASANWKRSPPFALQLEAGKTYDVGAIADVSADWSIDSSGTDALGILGTVPTNPNFSTFSAPTAGNHSVADGAVRLHGAPAPLIFDSFDGTTNLINRSAGDAPGNQITPSQDTVITNIAVRNRLDSAGNLRFLIFEHPSHTLVWESEPEPFDADVSPTWKKSKPFGFQLRADQAYDIGAIADVSGAWAVDTSATAQAGLQSDGGNANFSDFSNPTSGPHGSAESAVRLYTQGLPIVDSFDPPGFTTTRSAGSAPGTHFTVNHDTIITNIAVSNQLSSAGDLKFVILDHADHSVVHVTAAESFDADSAETWKTSSLPIAIQLRGGREYDIGAIADVTADWSKDATANTGGGMTSSGDDNPNFTDFANPAFFDHSTTDGAVRLLPEPGGPLALALATAWLGALAAARAKRRR